MVAIARLFEANLGLPQHGRGDDDTATPLFLFGEAMLDLLVCHGTALAIETGVGGDQFATFARLKSRWAARCLGAGTEDGFGGKASKINNSAKIGLFGRIS